MEPLVTIGLPIYNAEAYLAECIESIKAQTLREFVVLAVLDGPTDDSASVLRKQADSRFQIIENMENLGVAKTSDLILHHCQTELIANMDSDDVMVHDRIEKQYGYMQAHPSIDMLGTYFDKIDRSGSRIELPYRFGVTPEEIREEFRLYPALHKPTLMCRTERIRQLGGYQSKYSEDSVMWLKGLANNYQYANLPECLHHYRIHSSSIMVRLREPSLKALDDAYAEFGPQIWGARAPDYVSGATRMERLKRRLKRNLSSLFSK